MVSRHHKHSSSYSSSEESEYKRSWINQNEKDRDFDAMKQKILRNYNKEGSTSRFNQKQKSTRKSTSESSESSSTESDDSSSSGSLPAAYDTHSKSKDKDKRKKAWFIKKQRKKEYEKLKKIYLVEYEKKKAELEEQKNLHLAVNQYISQKIDTIIKKRQFFNGPIESPQITETELKRIVVTLSRNIPNVEESSGNGDIKCDFNNLEEVIVPRRPDEGVKLLFDREEIRLRVSSALTIFKDSRTVQNLHNHQAKRIRTCRRSESRSSRSRSVSSELPHKISYGRYHSKSSSEDDYPRRRRSRDRSSSRSSDQSYYRSYSSEQEDDRPQNKYLRGNPRGRARGRAWFMNRGRGLMMRGRGFGPRPMLMRPGLRMQRPFNRGGRGFPMGPFRPPFRPQRFMHPPNMPRPHFQPMRFGNPSNNTTSSNNASTSTST